MKSKFKKEQRTRTVFQKKKRKTKVPNFQESSSAFRLRTVGKYGASWKVEWGFSGTFNVSAKVGHKRKRMGRRILNLNPGCIENPPKSCNYFRKKIPS